MPVALVTGATGFIGSHLCRALLEQGWLVRAFHRAASPLVNLTGLPVEHFTGDLTLPETLPPALAGVQVVFHAAAQLGPSTADQHQSVNILGTRSLLAAARQAGVQRVVHTSSVAALGVPLLPPPGALPQPMDETHTWNFPSEWWPYGNAKYQAELEVQRAVANGQDVVIVNPAVVIGAGDLNRISLGVIEQVARGWLYYAPPGGLNAIHVNDVVKGHLAALHRGKTGERYILGNENMTHFQFLQTIAASTGRRPLWGVLPGAPLRLLATPAALVAGLFTSPATGHTLHRVGMFFYYDLSKARQELDFQPVCSIQSGIHEAYQWGLENPPSGH